MGEIIAWGKPHITLFGQQVDFNAQTSLRCEDMPTMRTDYRPMAFVSIGRKFKKTPNVRYRIPRKAKKRFKTNMCKYGWDVKKLKFSYKRLNKDVDGR